MLLLGSFSTLEGADRVIGGAGRNFKETLFWFSQRFFAKISFFRFFVDNFEIYAIISLVQAYWPIVYFVALILHFFDTAFESCIHVFEHLFLVNYTLFFILFCEFNLLVVICLSKRSVNPKKTYL